MSESQLAISALNFKGFTCREENGLFSTLGGENPDKLFEYLRKKYNAVHIQMLSVFLILEY